MRETRTVLSIGATGSIGRHVVEHLLRQGFAVRALVRSPERARSVLPDAVSLVRGDLATGEGVADAVVGVDAIVMTHGGEPRDVDYGGVLAVLDALGQARPHIVLMTSMVTSRGSDAFGGVLHWKRGGERLLRASGLPSTIVRPGWFDHQDSDQTGVVLEQGDTTPFDDHRGVGRAQIAQTLVGALGTDTAVGVTLELFSASGSMPTDWAAAFGALDKDSADTLAGAHDAGVALADEPAAVLAGIARIRG